MVGGGGGGGGGGVEDEYKYLRLACPPGVGIV